MTVEELGERMSAQEFGLWIAEFSLRGALQAPDEAPDPVGFFNSVGVH